MTVILHVAKYDPFCNKVALKRALFAELNALRLHIDQSVCLKGEYNLTFHENSSNTHLLYANIPWKTILSCNDFTTFWSKPDIKRNFPVTYQAIHLQMTHDLYYQRWCKQAKLLCNISWIFSIHYTHETLPHNAKKVLPFTENPVITLFDEWFRRCTAAHVSFYM